MGWWLSLFGFALFIVNAISVAILRVDINTLDGCVRVTVDVLRREGFSCKQCCTEVTETFFGTVSDTLQCFVCATGSGQLDDT